MSKLIATAMLLLVPVTACSGSTRTVAGPTVTAHATVSATVSVTATATATETQIKRLRPTIVHTVATHTRTVTTTFYPKYNRFGEGVYVVGRDIKPGEYHSKGSSDCYWARLASLNTSDIIDNNDGAGPQTVDVESSDRAFQVGGTCTFGRI